MANNRLYLKCKVCGREFYLGKNFGGAFDLPIYKTPTLKHTEEEFCKEFEDFLHRHFFCSPSDGGAFEIEKEWDADESKWQEPFSDEDWEQINNI